MTLHMNNSSKKQFSKVQELINLGRFAEAEEILLELMKRELTENPTDSFEIDLLNEFGKLKFRLGDSETAIQSLQQGLELSEKLNYLPGKAYALNYLGAVSWSKGKLTESLKQHEKSLDIRKQLNDLVGVSFSLHNIALVHFNLGDSKKALKLFDEALEIEKTLDDQISLVITLHNIGDVHLRSGNLVKAKTFEEKAYQLAKEINNQNGIFLANYSLALIAWARRDINEAETKFNESIKLSKELRRKGTPVAQIYHDYSQFLSERRKFEQSKDYIRKIQDIAENTKSERNWFYFEYCNGVLAKILGNTSTAKNHFVKCLEISQKTQLFEHELKSLLQLAENCLSFYLLSQEDDYLDETMKHLANAWEGARKQRYFSFLVQVGILRSMIDKARIDYDKAEAELTQVLITCEERDLPRYHARAQAQLDQIYKLKERAKKMIKQPSQHEQIEEVRDYIERFSDILKTFKT